jgi:hypothetical protein
MSEEKTFADGFVFKRNPNAPQFVVGRLSLKVEDAVAFIQDNQKNGWVNLDIKQARSGNYYVELDTFEKQASNETSAPSPSKKAAAPAEEDDDVPF